MVRLSAKICLCWGGYEGECVGIWKIGFVIWSHLYPNVLEVTNTICSAPSDEMTARIPQELENKWSHLGLDRSFESPDIVESLLRSGRSNTMGA